MSENRRKKNILRELGYKHTLFGIPAAYCNWYLDNPSMHNPITDYLYNQMLISTGTAKVAGSLVSKASETFIKKRDGLEGMMVPKSANLTDADIRVARKVGMVIGIIFVVLIVYVVWGMMT